MKTLNQKLPLEQRSREETEQLKVSWNKGAYHFLLQRTFNHYYRKKTAIRRTQIQNETNHFFYVLNDKMLMALYQHACTKYQATCKYQYGNSSGFLKTPSEIKFMNTLESILDSHPELKGIEVYPSRKYTNKLPPMTKLVAGNHVPDFILFGVKSKGSSAIAIEIDGDSHISKLEKDFLKYDHLKSLKIFTLSIPNTQVQDHAFILSILKDLHREPSGALSEQTKYAKRMLWAKTIACNMSLHEIDTFIADRFKIQLYLELEAIKMLQLKDCPRNIKRELLK